MVKKIVIIGPESTGKSTLCEQLAAHYHTIWVKEYAREYLLQNGTEYSFETLLDIAKGQVAGEELAIQQLSTINHQPSTNQPSTLNPQPSQPSPPPCPSRPSFSNRPS